MNECIGRGARTFQTPAPLRIIMERHTKFVQYQVFKAFLYYI